MSVLPINAEADLDPGDIFRAIRFEGLRAIIVAVSGGSDSLALLQLLMAFGATRSAFPEIVAVTIDHGLRPESALEAQYVATLCRQAGVSHRILNWTGPKPDTGISAKAREVRYRLLCDAARDADTDLVLAGHTLDDQIETFVMRSARRRANGSDRGLAGMAPATLLNREIWLVRPLLDISRERLREYLRMHGVGWCDDPSNDDPKYERVRIRKALCAGDREKIKVIVSGNVEKRRSLNARTAHVLAQCVTNCDGIRAEINRGEWSRNEEDVQRLAIGVLLATVGGRSFLPSERVCEKALDRLSAADWTGRTTIARCVLQLKKDRALLYREMRSIPEIVIKPGESALWDGRYRIGNHSNKTLKVIASGTKGLDLLQGSSFAGFHRPSLLSSPALLLDEASTLVPAIADHAKLPEGITVTKHLALFDHILSEYDHTLAQSVAEIFAAGCYKRPPVNQVNKN